jgi:hypothetical protein
MMEDIVKQEEVKGEPYDYSKDLKILTLKEKRGILKNAKTLLNLQRSNSPIPSLIEEKKKAD